MDYIFPDILGKFMSKVDFRVQLEATMLSLTFILIGLFVSALYILFYVGGIALWYKIFLVLNAVAGFIFLSSFIITTYHQYKTYMETLQFQKELEGGKSDAKEKQKK